jgi:hypothetical protein
MLRYAIELTLLPTNLALSQPRALQPVFKSEAFGRPTSLRTVSNCAIAWLSSSVVRPPLVSSGGAPFSDPACDCIHAA